MINCQQWSIIVEEQQPYHLLGKESLTILKHQPQLNTSRE
jgi:hypothetical protein